MKNLPLQLALSANRFPLQSLLSYKIHSENPSPPPSSSVFPLISSSLSQKQLFSFHSESFLPKNLNKSSTTKKISAVPSKSNHLLPAGDAPPPLHAAGYPSITESMLLLLESSSSLQKKAHLSPAAPALPCNGLQLFFGISLPRVNLSLVLQTTNLIPHQPTMNGHVAP